MAKLWESRKERSKYIDNLYEQMREAYGPDCEIDFPGKYADLGVSGFRWRRVAETFVRNWEKEVRHAERAAMRHNAKAERVAARTDRKEMKRLINEIYEQKLEGTAYRPQDKGKALAEATQEAHDIFESAEVGYDISWMTLLDEKPTLESIMAEYPIEKPEEVSEGISVEDYVTENGDEVVEDKASEITGEDVYESVPEELADETPTDTDEDGDEEGFEDGEELTKAK